MRKSILLIDDDIEFIQLYTKVLEPDFEICYTINLKDTLNFLKQSPFQIDLIICDIFMPEINGFELFDFLQKEEEIHPIPLVFKTSSLNQSVIEESIVKKGTELISTYMSNEEIKARIKRSLIKSPIFKICQKTPIVVDSESNEIIFPKVSLPIILSQTEVKVLRILSNKPNFVPKKELINEVYGKDYVITDNNFNTSLSNLRKKLSPLNLTVTSKRNQGLKIDSIQVEA